MSGDATGPIETRMATALRWAGAVAIALVAVVRCVVIFAPQVVFDVDPAIDPNPLPGLGPAGSLFLDSLLLAACGAALLGEVRSGRGVEWPLLALALVPAPIVVYHGWQDLGDLWRGATWVAAAVACATVAHLGRDRAVRFVLLSLLAATLVPVLARGVLQSSVTVGDLTIAGAEHRDTLLEFESGREAFYADRGWEADSPAARIYERRLRQAEPRGWFPTVNVFASLMAFGLVLGAGLAFGAIRDGIGPRWVTLFALACAVTAAALLTSRSKGAMLAGVAGLGLLAVMLAPGRARDLWARAGGLIVLALPAAALLGVVVRGVLLPEAFAGDRSLLFRWHYLSGAARMFGASGPTGVGPDGFQASYMGVRSPRSPEEVTTAHSMVADWLATLGVSGVAWVVLAGVLLWRAARGATPASSSAYVTARTTLLSAGAVAVLGLVPAIVIEASLLDGPVKELARGVGVVGFVLAAVGLGLGLERIRGAIVQAALTAGAVVLVLHGQIEMTFFDGGAVTWAMCLLGLAGGAAASRDARAWPGYALAGLLLALGAGLATTWAARAARAQSIMVEATRLVHPPAESAPMQALQRREAAGLLESAWREHLPGDARLVEQAVRQLLIAAALAEPARGRTVLSEAIALGEEAAARHDTPALHAVLGEALWLEARRTGDPVDWRAAIDRNSELVALDPQGISGWRRLGDLLWEFGDRAQASTAYGRALAADAAFELDPLKQLSERDRAAIRARIAERGKGAGPP